MNSWRPISVAVWPRAASWVTSNSLGVSASVVDITVFDTTTFAMLGMINWIYQWYRPGGRLDEDTLADALTDLFLGGILGRPAGAR